MGRSKIEWLARPGTTPESWNPVTGCTKISEGCRNCYAERMARRLAGRFGYPAAPNHFDVTIHKDRFWTPAKWRKPRTVFVCSMSDIAHPDVPDAVINHCTRYMALARRQHTWLVLTKRPGRLLELWKDSLPIENLWLGVTVENQKAADERIPLLLQTPAAVRFVSCEPLLEKIDLKRYFYFHPSDMRIGPRPHLIPSKYKRLKWVIVGGESGPGARPMRPDWVRSLRDQCQAAGTPLHFKQWGHFLPECQWDDIKESDGHLPNPCSVLGTGHGRYFGVGKHRAGRLLDGREWNEWPK